MYLFIFFYFKNAQIKFDNFVRRAELARKIVSNFDRIQIAVRLVPNISVFQIALCELFCYFFDVNVVYFSPTLRYYFVAVVQLFDFQFTLNNEFERKSELVELSTSFFRELK